MQQYGGQLSNILLVFPDRRSPNWSSGICSIANRKQSVKGLICLRQ